MDPRNTASGDPVPPTQTSALSDVPLSVDSIDEERKQPQSGNDNQDLQDDHVDLLPPDSFAPDLPELDSDLAEIATVELNEPDGPERRAALWGLTQRCEKEGISLPSHIIPDLTFLLAFLRVSKFDIEHAWQRVKRFSEIRKNLGLVDSDLSAQYTSEVLRSEMFVFPGTKDKAGKKLMIINVDQLDAKRFAFATIQKALILLLLKELTSDETQICGFTVVLDFENVAFRNILGTLGKMKNAKFVVEMFQECFPLRVKRLLIVREPWYVNALYMVVRPILKRKLRDRVAVLNDPVLLGEFIEQDQLLSKYGGSATYDAQNAYRKLVTDENGVWTTYETLSLQVEDEAHYQTASLGIIVENQSDDYTAVVVTNVRPKSIGERLGIRLDDIIWSVNGVKTYVPRDIPSAQRHRSGGGLEVVVRRKIESSEGLTGASLYEYHRSRSKMVSALKHGDDKHRAVESAKKVVRVEVEGEGEEEVEGEVEVEGLVAEEPETEEGEEDGEEEEGEEEVALPPPLVSRNP